jgi:hypothetical protein
VKRSLATSLITALLLAPLQMQAQVPMRAVSAAFGAQPSVTFSARDFADANVRKKLQSGLPQTLVTRVYAYREHGKEPLAVAVLSCRVVYDLWEGVYRIARQTEHSDKTLAAKSLEGVLQQCLEAKPLAVGKSADFAKERGKRVYFAMLVELNPLSQDTVQRIRRWLARPGGSQLEGNAFFGSFVSIFVSRKLGAAEKSLGFRSEPLPVPP